ncbi:hypothetical protein ACGFI9_21060 [Micromonospora sp. NPDC048930]|uniref:hypothetical protein n=1 Tax=Micromonospora sp. NPDC048930 TaxID=3364261 RepID=UPI00371F35F1
MLTRSAWRWLAGLGVAGAFVAASAVPAAAADAPFTVVAADLLVAPGQATQGVVRAASPDPDRRVEFGRTTLDVDFSGISGFAVLSPSVGADGWMCDHSGSTLHCEADIGDGDEPSLDFRITARKDAAPGGKGDVSFSLRSAGQQAATSATVTLTEAVDLQAGPPLAASAPPAGEFGVRPTVRNGAEVTSHGAVVNFTANYHMQFMNEFTNCRYNLWGGTACTFDQDLEPGRTYQVDSDLRVKLFTDARSGAHYTATAQWWTKDDWAEAIKDQPPGDTGEDRELRLVEVTGVRARTSQTDPDPANNRTDITVTVTGDQYADATVTGAKASGRKGDVVRVVPTLRNLGPALMEYQHGPLVRVAIPPGTTAVRVARECQPYTTDEAWDPSNGDWGEPGARQYACYASDTGADWHYRYAFQLRIDKVVPNATGAVRVKLPGDPNSSNDSAAIVINPTGDGGQGGGGLPITGPPTGLIAGVGALLLAAGLATYAATRRRNTDVPT